MRHLVNGRPVNVFMGVEGLQHVHVQGHKDAIEQGTLTHYCIIT